MRPQHLPAPELPGPYEFAHVIGDPTATDAGFLYPLDLAVDGPARHLYVVCRQQDSVARWTLDGDYVDQFGQPGSAIPEGRPGPVSSGLLWPAGIALDAEGTVYVTEEGSHRLQKLDASGRFVARWGGSGGPDRLPVGGARHGQFNCPSGVAIDAAGRVYVVDTLNHRVQQFTPEGLFLAQWGTPGAGAGRLDMPWGIDVDGSRGRVLVSDWRNDRLQAFDLEGRFVATIGRPGSAPGELRRPAGLAVDAAGNIAVADWGNDRVQVLAPDGTPLAVLTGHGDRLTKVAQVYMAARDDLVKQRAEAGGGHPLEPYFWAPTGVAFDGAGTLYAADTLRHRVQVYRRRRAPI
jgi:DNA-binding beta-propeller fold protein YncE